MTDKKVKWDILGPGRIAHNFAEGLQVIEDASLYAVASSKIERAKEFADQYGGAKKMKKIMVVDDDIEATQLLQAILSRQGYEVVAVNDSMMAVQRARQVFPHMFLLDLMMPKIDGFKLCRILREDRNFMVTPIIILTALNDEDSKAVAFGAGANDYITKPYHPAKLLTLIKEFFQPGVEV